MLLMNISNKILIPIMIVAAFFAFSEIDKPDKNIYVIIIAMLIIMLGMIKLSAKTPSKNPENQNNDV